MTGMKNTFNPNTSVLGGTIPKPVTDIDTVGEVKNIKGGKINLDDNSIQWLRDAGAIEFVNRFTTMRPILRVILGTYIKRRMLIKLPMLLQIWLKMPLKHL